MRYTIRMRFLIPAIIANGTHDLEEKIEIVASHVTWAQIDVMDGTFVRGTSWPYREGSLDDLMIMKGALKIEAHLMIQNPERVVAAWALAGVDRIIVHPEATEGIGSVMEALAESRAELGVALKLGTPIDVIEPWIEDISVVQLMGIEKLGAHGELFNDAVIKKIAAVRSSYGDITISIDGGVTVLNAPHLLELGVDNLVVGGAIWNAPDPRAALDQFHTLL